MKLSDLFKPKWQSSDSDKRLEAIDELEDQTILISIAQNDEDKLVRRKL